MTSSKAQAATAEPAASGTNQLLLIVTWLWVGLPFLYGVYKLITTASKLFVH